MREWPIEIHSREIERIFILSLSQFNYSNICIIRYSICISLLLAFGHLSIDYAVEISFKSCECFWGGIIYNMSHSIKDFWKSQGLFLSCKSGAVSTGPWGTHHVAKANKLRSPIMVAQLNRDRQEVCQPKPVSKEIIKDSDKKFGNRGQISWRDLISPNRPNPTGNLKGMPTKETSGIHGVLLKRTKQKFRGLVVSGWTLLQWIDKIGAIHQEGVCQTRI